MDTSHDVLYPIKFIEPLATNVEALGYDVGTESRRRTAIELAIGSGKPTMTARLELVQDDLKLSGFLYFVPFYSRGSNPKSPEERMRDLVGVLYAPIIIDNAFAGIVAFTDNLVQFDVYDGQKTDNGELLFEYNNHRTEITNLTVDASGKRGHFNTVREVVVGGRIWTVRMNSSPKFDTLVGGRDHVLVGGGLALLSVLLAAVLWSMGNSRYRAEALAEAMTQDLAAEKRRADMANQSKSEFLANMSHEIRTPLTAILGYASILKDEGDISKAPPKRIEALNTILSGGEHLLSIINDILDLSKIEAGKVTMEQIETPLVQIVADIESLMRPRAQDKGVALRTVFDTPVPDRIVSDPTRVRQILMNLVGNAVKFTEAGAIEIRLAAESQYGRDVLRVSIKDTGAGMTPEQVNVLFQPFSQADGSVTRKHGGTGLGLTISRRLAQGLGGDVRLQHTTPGRGSLFVLVMPLEAYSGAGLVTDLNVTAPEVGDAGEDGALECELVCRMLLAEDNAVNQKLLKHHLTRAGARIDVANNGREAMEMLLEADQTDDPFRLLLTDMQMPEMDGYTLARTLRDRGHAIPIIALTAHAMAEDRQKCLDAGCNDYVAKPIDRAALLLTCRRWCSCPK